MQYDIMVEMTNCIWTQNAQLTKLLSFEKGDNQITKQKPLKKQKIQEFSFLKKIILINVIWCIFCAFDHHIE
jgi:hypothetical protein